MQSVQPSMQQIALDLDLAPRACLEHFWAVDPAQVQALQHVAGTLDTLLDPAEPPLPTYLWGDVGCGKTHLLHAALFEVQKQGGLAGYLNSQSTEPQIFNAGWRLVAIDDVDTLSPLQQQMAFNWFVHAQAEACWVLAAGRLAPTQLPVRKDLKSRFAWGHVFALSPLQEAERRLVLQNAAQARGLRLSTEVVDFIWRRFARDLSHLMALLDQIDRYALRTQRAVTIPMLRRMMEEW